MNGSLPATPTDETLVRPRWPLLDGVRGVAVVLVVIYHLHIPPFRHGGFLGVEIFFVLSGFLITSLIVGEWTAASRISAKSFYARRFVRLYPAQLAVSLAVVVLALTFAASGSRKPFIAGALSTMFYFGNWVKSFGWYGQGALSHTWSLAIEEQYYLVWPLVSILALKHGGARTLFKVAGGLTVAFTVSRLAMYGGGTSLARLYNGTDTRAPALLVGSAAGALVAGGLWRPRIPKFVVPVTLVAAVALSVFVVESRSLIAIGLIPIDVVIVVLIVSAALGDPSSAAGRVLTSRPARLLGQWSYSLYLWHKVVIVLVRSVDLGLGPVGTPLLQTALFIPAALVSYYVIERPFLGLRARFERPCAVPASASPASVHTAVSAPVVSGAESGGTSR